jgi:ABC-type Fe3+/spermidine/putrescine transport system ATPase subunit
MNAVELRGVSHSYGRTVVLKEIDLAIEEGEFFGILGPSGSGKTTILRIIAGFVAPVAGTLMMTGQDMAGVSPNRRSSAMVFQQLALFPHMTVFQNIAYGLAVRQLPKATIQERVETAMEIVRLAGFGKRFPRQLSGGQQQRVALARAIVIEPSVVLFDEPLASLDKGLRVEMQEELRRIHVDIGSTFIYVTHDQQEAMKMCDRIAVMEGGRITQIGTPQEVYEHPASHSVARFVGEINVFPCRVHEVERERIRINYGSLDLGFEVKDAAVRVGDEIYVCVRPERVTIGAAGCALRWPMVVVNSTYLGGHRRYELEADGATKVLVDDHSDSEVRVGDGILAGWNVADCMMFRPDGHRLDFYIG